MLSFLFSDLMYEHENECMSILKYTFTNWRITEMWCVFFCRFPHTENELDPNNLGQANKARSEAANQRRGEGGRLEPVAPQIEVSQARKHSTPSADKKAELLDVKRPAVERAAIELVNQIIWVTKKPKKV